MLIGGLQKLTLIDYPGKLACTVFTIGCNFRCPFCYSKELVLAEEIKKQPRISESDFFDFLKKRKKLLEGVCICGAEPTIHKDLPDFLKKIKSFGYSVKLDTNGSNPQMLAFLINQNLIDYVAMDIKAPKRKYLKVIGLEGQMGLSGIHLDFWKDRIVENVQKSIDILKNSNIDYEFRTTVVPKLLTKRDFLKIAKWISPGHSTNSGQASKYFLQNFRPQKTISPEFEKLKPRSEEYLVEVQKSVASFFDTCRIRE
jgi:pyruvate formate lyase activating enzyme